MADPSYLLQGQYIGGSGKGQPAPAAGRLISPSGFYHLQLNAYPGLADISVNNADNTPGDVTQLWASPNFGGYKSGNIFMLLQADGNLCLYLGDGPAAVSASNLIWASGAAPGPGLYYVILQDDGNLCVYDGNTIGQGNLVWRSGLTDLATEITFGYLNYDFAAGTIQVLAPYELYSDTLSNDTDSDTQVPVKGAEEAPETLVWEQTPIINPGSIQISPIIATPPRVSNGQFILLDDQPQADVNVEEESSKEWNWYELVTVPAGSEVTVSVTVQMARIAVPFTWVANVVYKSGQTYHVPYSGVFSGLTSHDLSITVTPVDPNK